MHKQKQRYRDGDDDERPFDKTFPCECRRHHETLCGATPVYVVQMLSDHTPVCASCFVKCSGRELFHEMVVG